MPPAPFLAPFGILAAVLSLALIAWLLTNVDFSKEGLPILIAGVAGLVIYIGTQLARKLFGNKPSESI
jgi:hypothetical protein